MKYKVLIKKCDDPALAARIAEEVARWSGSTPDAVSSVITKKQICIRREADENEAARLRQQFSAVGAVVELVPLEQAGAGKNADDDDDAPGRILSDSEMTEILKRRSDIFVIEKETRLRNMELVSIILGIIFGIWLTTLEFTEVATDFFEKMPEERVAKLVKELPATLDKKKEEEKKEEIKTEKKTIKPQKSKGAGGQTGGG